MGILKELNERMYRQCLAPNIHSRNGNSSCHNIIPFSFSVLLVTPFPDSLLSSSIILSSFFYSCLYILAFFLDLKQYHFVVHHWTRFFSNFSWRTLPLFKMLFTSLYFLITYCMSKPCHVCLPTVCHTYCMSKPSQILGSHLICIITYVELCTRKAKAQWESIICPEWKSRHIPVLLSHHSFQLRSQRLVFFLD